MSFEIPDTAPLSSYEPQLNILPPPPYVQPVPALAPVSAMVRDRHKPVAEVFLSAVASTRHALEDAVILAMLPRGGVVLGVGDATTNAINCQPVDAMEVVVNALVAEVQASGSAARVPSAVQIMRQADSALRRWLASQPDAACGVAQTVAVVEGQGHAQLVSVGDSVALHFQPRRFLRAAKLTNLNAIQRNPTTRKLCSSLGQAPDMALRLQVCHAHLAPGDVLLLASDGGLPGEPMHRALKALLETYASDRAVQRTTLRRLGEVLDNYATRHSSYCDDRSIVLYQRL